MVTRRSISAVALLTLAFSAFATAGASATDRAYKCESVSSGATFSDAHCLTSSAGPSGFNHTLLPETFTAITITNAKTASGTTASSPAVLKGHIAGVETAITCTTVSGSGSINNEATTVSGFAKLTFSGCTVTLPAGKGCKVAGGTIETKELFVTTFGTNGTKVAIQSLLSKGVMAEDVLIEGCEKERPPKAKYFIEGEYDAPTSGATVIANHIDTTAQGKLKFGGSVAGIEGALTISAGSSGVTLTP